MTIAPLASRYSRVRPFAGSDRLIRNALFLATFLHIWLTASPFPDLSDASALELSTNANVMGQIIAIVLTGALGAFALTHQLRVIAQLVTPILVVIFLWFACSAVLSLHPDIAARRLLLASFVLFHAGMFVFLPEDRVHFARLLAIGALFVLALCYAGVIFAPHFSVHQVTDLEEPRLAGNWRGFFAHKNGAGSGMAILIIFGIYIFRRLSRGLGSLVVALATFFLVFTESKSSMMLLPLALIFSVVFVRLRNAAAKLIVLVGVPAIIGVLTIGSVQFAAVNTLVGVLMPDPTFTGRDDIWQFALDHIAQHPIVGFGFHAFWGTSELVNSWTWLGSWGYRASDAHNGYLNIAVMTGLVGLVLTLGWVFVRPFIDYVRTPLGRTDPALNLMFIQTWLFGLYLCGLESELFQNGNIVWFMTVVSIFGLRLQASANYVGESA
ncbi:O-antigen ligase [Bradyrhizobium sp. i1.8.4]|uniref:O-antigen ligase family protein n=1 Tax=unclassified Bradyrhizobium TaxID=2631580 RepID=UPI003D1A0848